MWKKEGYVAGINRYKFLSVTDHSGRYIFPGYVSEEMIEKFSWAVLFTLMKVIISLMVNLWQLMVL
jgi:hypothetical protein